MIENILINAIGPLFRRWKREKIKYQTYYNFGRYYHAPIWPFKIYWIKSSQINHISQNIECEIPSIQSGDWDLNKEPINDNVVYESFISHFEKDIKWENTEYYKKIESKVKQDSHTWKGCNNINEVKNRLVAYDELYKVVKTEGFKSQFELREKNLLNDELMKLRYHPPELEDIAMNLSRSGEYMLSNGLHRVSVAKIIGIDKIPIRVRHRHKFWQQTRDKVYTGQKVPYSIRNHPDLEQL